MISNRFCREKVTITSNLNIIVKHVRSSRGTCIQVFFFSFSVCCKTIYSILCDFVLAVWILSLDLANES